MELGPLAVAAHKAHALFTSIVEWERERGVLPGEMWGEALMGEIHSEVALDLVNEFASTPKIHESMTKHALEIRIGGLAVSAGVLCQCQELPESFRYELARLRTHPALRACEPIAPSPQSRRHSEGVRNCSGDAIEKGHATARRVGM